MIATMSAVTFNVLDMKDVPNKSTPLRECVIDACREALLVADVSRMDWKRVGIVCSTKVGDRYPETFAEHRRTGKRLSAYEFGSSVLNSAIGPAILDLSLTGPQIVVTDGSPFIVATQLLESGRCHMVLLVVIEDREQTVTCNVLEMVGDNA